MPETGGRQQAASVLAAGYLPPATCLSYLLPATCLKTLKPQVIPVRYCVNRHRKRTLRFPPPQRSYSEQNDVPLPNRRIDDRGFARQFRPAREKARNKQRIGNRVIAEDHLRPLSFARGQDRRIDALIVGSSIARSYRHH